MATAGPGQGDRGTSKGKPQPAGSKGLTDRGTDTGGERAPGRGATAKPAAQPDWAQVYWGSLGLPPDVATHIDQIFRQYGDNTQTQLIAQQYMRSTKWYAATFPGIEYGVRAGILDGNNPEQSYRAYVNDMNNAYQQWTGQAVTGAQVTQWLQQGQKPDYVNRFLEGQSRAVTEKGNLQALAGAQTPQGQLTPAELSALTQQEAGNSSALGLKIAARLDAAQKRLSGVFQGVSATGSLNLGQQGLSSPSMLGAKGTPDIGA